MQLASMADQASQCKMLLFSHEKDVPAPNASYLFGNSITPWSNFSGQEVELRDCNLTGRENLDGRLGLRPAPQNIGFL